MSALNRIEFRVLETLRFRDRDEHWKHITLNKLARRGLVAIGIIDGSNAIRRWSITDAGREAVKAAA